MENKIKEDELRFRHDSEENLRNEYDLTKYVRLMPQFNESDVDKYFQHLRKLLKICIGLLKMYGLRYFSRRFRVTRRKHLRLYLLMSVLIMML